MTNQAWIMFVTYITLLLALSWPLGIMIDTIMTGQFEPGKRFENLLFRLAGVQPEIESNWKHYTLGLLLFNAIGVLAVFSLQLTQHLLPFNPQHLPAVTTDSALNTAVSFVTNTNWQGYSGETTMSYLAQFLGLTVQNFLSTATGIVVAVAMMRGFARHSVQTIGNVWVDLTRSTLWILLPLALVFALILTSQGVIQNLSPYQELQTLEGQSQTIAMGPVASQLAIKMLGTNGGGFFNTNSAHPFENPTPLVNFLQMLSIFLIPTALCFVFGRQVGDLRQGWTILMAMLILFSIFAVATIHFEQQGNPRLTPLGIDQLASSSQSGGNMEGKEVRFGIAASGLFAAITTAASCGAVNAMHDSFTPLGGAMPLILIQLGEVVFGGVGSGLYGMLVFAMMAVFLAGLMIGRTPEYLGKKIETFEMKMIAIIILITPLIVLGGTAFTVVVDAGRAGIFNTGIHGFTEILYALSSAGNNNGSAFAGLAANTVFYNVLLAVIMALGRFGVLVPVLAISGALAGKKRLAATDGSLPTHGPLFVALLIGTVLLVGLLNYVPALALGPVVEHLVLWGN